METMSHENEQRFRSLRRYEDYFAPSPDKTDSSRNSNEYVLGAEIARRAFDTVKQQMEAEKNQAPWEKQTRNS